MLCGKILDEPFLTTPEETISLFAELSLVLAGFAGVVSAFSGRERQFRPTELIRLTHVLSCSATILAGCLGYFTCSAGGYSVAHSVATAGVASCAFAAVLLPPLTQRAWRSGRDPDSTSEPWTLFAIPAVNFCVIFLFGFAAVSETGSFPLIGGFSIQLLVGLWLFARLLTRPN